MSSPTQTTVEVNGLALREIRVRTGIASAVLAEQVGISRSYLAKIELGHSPRVSPQVYAEFLSALAIADFRTLLANPQASSEVSEAS